MNYLKTLFPVTNTLQGHLRHFNQLSEEKIAESTKHFPYTILVCDKREPSNLFTGGSTPCEFRFSDLLDIGQRKRDRLGEIFVLDSLNILPWTHFHSVVGDAIVRYFLECACVFRSLKKDDNPRFVVQIAGSPVFPNVTRRVQSQAVATTSAKKKRKKVEVVERRDQVEEIPNGRVKRKKHRRGKRKKRKVEGSTLPSVALPSTTSLASREVIPRSYREAMAASFRIPAKRFLHCVDMREQFVGSTDPIATYAMRNSPVDRSLLEKTFCITPEDEFFEDAKPAMNAVALPIGRWIKRHRRSFCYSAYLNLFCPIDESLLVDCTNELEQLPNLVRRVCSKVHVMRILEAIFYRVIPMDLFGENNTARLLKAVIQFVVRAGRYDVVSLHQFAYLIKSSKCPFLGTVRSAHLRQHLILRLLNIVIRYLFCIVSSCFYVTESQSTKNRLLFYRKPIWRRVVRIASTEFARRCQFQPAAKLKNELPFYGPFALRWVPKSNGEVRPIIFGRAGPQRRSNKSKGGYGGTVKAMNYDLRPVLAIAQFLVRSRPEVLGHSTSGFSDIHRQWKAYVKDQRRQRKINTTPYYIVKADVTACFDSINQELLWSVIENELLANAPEEFVLQGHYAIRSSATTKSKSSGSTFTSRKYRYSVRAGDHYVSLARYYTKLENNPRSRSKGKSGIIVLPHGEPFSMTKRVVANRLGRSIFRRVLMISGDRRKYCQTCGIGQGTSLSVLLCDLYLAALEKKYLDPIINVNEDLLIRFVDDYFYITPDIERARRFAVTLSNGFDDFNCFFKIKKTITNFEWCRPCLDLDGGGIIEREIISLVPWCGLLIDSTNLNVLIDSGCWRLKEMRDFIAVDFSSSPCSYVVRKILHYLRTRAFEIAFDRVINSPLSLRQNVRRLTAFLAGCFAAFVKAYEQSFVIPEHSRSKLRDPAFIDGLAKRIYRCLRRRLKKGNSERIIDLSQITKSFRRTLK